MKTFFIYLGGPITGLTYDETADWRKEVSKKLPPYIKALSPMRAKNFLESEKAIKDSYEDHPIASKKGIVCRDRNDVKRSDLILFNFLGAKKVSIGSVMEVAWGDAYRKPMIVVMEKDNIHYHSMLSEVVGFIVPTLDEAVLIATALLLPEP
jgi:hypothetical protein